MGGRLAHFVEHWEKLTDNKWVLSVVRNSFRIPFRLIPHLSSVTIKLSQSSSPRRDRDSSPKMGSGKGTRSGNSQLLFPSIPCTKKEWKVTSSHISFFTEPIHKETTIQDGDSQVSKTIDCLHSLHRLDRYLPSRSDTSSILKISSSMKIRYSNSWPYPSKCP